LDFFLRQIKPSDVQEKYVIGEKETTEHGVTLVDAPLLLKCNLKNQKKVGIFEVPTVPYIYIYPSNKN
jgi:hypothetical protein